MSIEPVKDRNTLLSDQELTVFVYNSNEQLVSIFRSSTVTPLQQRATTKIVVDLSSLISNSYQVEKLFHSNESKSTVFTPLALY